MDPIQIADQLPALLGAGAGAAAKGAAGAAGKAVFERLRERLGRARPAEAERLDQVLAELEALGGSLAQLAEDDEGLRQAIQDLAASVEVTLVAGSQLVNYGDIDRSVIARDVNTIHMS